MKRMTGFIAAVLLLFLAGFIHIVPVVAADGPPPVQYGSPIDTPPDSYTVFLPLVCNDETGTLSPQSDAAEVNAHSDSDAVVNAVDFTEQR
jgi:hypothetical protein